MNIRLLLVVSSLLILLTQSSAQDRSGVPFSWSSSGVFESTLVFEHMPEVNVFQLLNEDLNEEQYKNLPYRFAHRHSASFNLQNSGRWFDLINNANLWILGIECPEAYGISLTFGEFYLPQGSRMYIYNEDHTRLIGGFTSEDNTPSGTLILPALPGERIIVEYYEPGSVAGEGELSIRSVAHVYKDIFNTGWDVDSRNECYINSSCGDARSWQEVSDATVQITVDGGTRWCNGVLVNQNGRWTRPYVITSLQAYYDSPDNWLFTFNHRSESCEHSNYNGEMTIEFSTSGAEILAIDEEAGLMMLRLFHAPTRDWDVFYSGWDRTENNQISNVACTHHPEGQYRKFSASEGSAWITTWNDLAVWQVDSWSTGTVGPGGVGAPLFNEEGQLIGIYAGGYDSCQDNGYEYFIPFSAAWDTFKNFLDPTD
ncbi:MAG: hypothetical protein KDC12_15260, partial [Flavobacteriales bacterium]|nr:hypothetical protein [Flavobacteriales bacterium]